MPVLRTAGAIPPPTNPTIPRTLQVSLARSTLDFAFLPSTASCAGDACQDLRHTSPTHVRMCSSTRVDYSTGAWYVARDSHHAGSDLGYVSEHKGQVFSDRTPHFRVSPIFKDFGQ